MRGVLILLTRLHVQNADDARASVIKFCLDCRTHGTGSLLAAEMAPFQGPALLAYNDGVFRCASAQGPELFRTLSAQN